MHNVHVYACAEAENLSNHPIWKRQVLMPKEVGWLYEKARECHMILSEINVQGSIPYVVNNGPIINHHQHKLVTRTRFLVSYLL